MTNIKTFDGNDIRNDSFAITSDSRTSLTSSDSLDSLTSYGNYKVTTSSIAKAVGAPSGVAGALIVITSSQGDKVYQIYFANLSSGIGSVFYRYMQSGTWKPWNRVISDQNATDFILTAEGTAWS